MLGSPGVDRAVETSPSSRRCPLCSTAGWRRSSWKGQGDAVGAVGERRVAGRGVLVQAVDAAGAGDIVGAGRGVGVVGARAGDDLVGRIVGERERLVGAAGAEVMAQRLQAAGAVIGV